MHTCDRVCQIAKLTYAIGRMNTQSHLWTSSLAFLMMYSVYNKLSKQGDNIQPWHTPFPIWNQSVVPCPVLTVASWPAYRILKRQVRWSGIPISLLTRRESDTTVQLSRTELSLMTVFTTEPPGKPNLYVYGLLILCLIYYLFCFLERFCWRNQLVSTLSEFYSFKPHDTL